MVAPVVLTAIANGNPGDRRAPVVFLHGVGQDAETWRVTFNAVAATGRRTLALNLPGHGGSPMLAPLDFDLCARCVIATLDDRGIERAVIAGHSFGGMVALELWAFAPARVAGLLFVASSPMFGSRDGSYEAAFLGGRLDPLDRGQTMMSLADGVTRAMVSGEPSDALLETVNRAFADIPPDAYRATCRALTGFDRRAALATIDVPTLLVAGTMDPTVPFKTMEKSAAIIPDSMFLPVEGAGHLPHLERPEIVNAALVAFLAETEDRRQDRPASRSIRL